MAKDKRDLRLIVIYPENGKWLRSEQDIPNSELCIRSMNKMIDYWWIDQKGACAYAVIRSDGAVVKEWNKLDEEGCPIYELSGKELGHAAEW